MVVLSFDAAELNRLVNPARGAGGTAASYGILVISDGVVLAHPDIRMIGRRLTDTEGPDALVLRAA